MTNTPPVAVADGPYYAEANELLMIDSPGLLANDSDADGDAMTVSHVNISETIGQVTASSLGGFIFNPDGQFGFLAQDETATTTFTYEAFDGLAHSLSPVTVTIIVSGANDIPAITSLSVDPPTIFENDTTSLSGSLTDNDTSEAHTVNIDWGDSTAPTTLNLNPGVLSFTTNHQFLDDGAGNYPIQVTVTDSDGGSDTSMMSVGVANVAPTVDAGPDQSVLENESTTFFGNFSDPGTLDTHTMTWNFGDGSPTVSGTLTPSHVYPNNGAYTVTLSVTDDDGGVGTSMMAVMVGNVPPIIDAGVDQSTTEGSVIAFSGSVVNSDPTDSYSWNFGDGSPTVSGTLTPNHIFADNGVYTVTLSVTDDDGGVSTDTLAVTVANQAPTVDAGSDRSVPGGETLIFSGSVTDPGSSDTFSYSWNFGDGTPATTGTLTPSHTYTTDGVFIATLTVTDKDGGVGSDTLSVTVTNTAPVVDVGADLSGVEGTPVLFDGTYTDSIGWGTHITSWNFGDGSPAVTGTLTPSHVFADDGVYSVTLSVTDKDGAVGTDSLIVSVANVPPIVDAGIDQSTMEGATVTFSGTLADAGANDTHTSMWNFGDGSPIVTGTLAPTHVFANSGTYTVTLTVSDDDGGVTSDTLTVNVGNIAPIVDAGIDQSTSEGTTAIFSGTVSNPTPFDTYSWNFGDGSPAVTGTLTPAHVFADDGVFAVTLTVSDNEGGVGTDTLTVTVGNVAPQVSAGVDQSVGEGSSTNFSGVYSDPGSLDTHMTTWNFGDNSVPVTGTLTPSHVFVDNGTYTITLTVTDDDGGVNTDTLIVNVVNVPPTVSAGVDQTANEGETLIFSGTVSDPGVLDTTTATWNFGDGSPAVTGTLTPSHVFADDGVYSVTLSVTDKDGAVGTDSLIVSVANVPPIVDAGIDQSTMEGATVTFSGTLADAGANDTHTSMWNFGDGSPIVTGTLAPTHVFANSGTYTVTLTVSDDDGGVTSDTLTVNVGNIAPIVDAGIDQSTSEGTTAIFSGTVSNPTPFDTYSWNFGDGSPAVTGTLTPAHVFADDGVFAVTLTVSDNEGGVGTDTLTVTVGNVAPQVSAGVDQSVGEGSSTNFSGVYSDPGSLDTHMTTWNFGDNSVPVTGTLTPSHVFVDNGTYTVTLTVTDDDGGVNTDTLTVNVVNVPPTVSAGVDQTANEGETLIFSGTVSDPGVLDTTTATWNFGDGSPAVTGTLTPSHVFADDGVYSVTLSVTDKDGAVGTDSLIVSVANVPPKAVDDGVYTLIEDMPLEVNAASGVLSNDLNPGQGQLTATVALLPLHGDLVLSSDGSFTYQPDLNYFGQDSFGYVTSDGVDTSAPARVSLNIAPVNDAPIPDDETAQTDEDTAVLIPVLPGDIDPENDTMTVIGVNLLGTTGALVTIGSDGMLTYDPAGHLGWITEGHTVTETFTYVVTDGQLTSEGTVTVTILGLHNDAPISANDGPYITDEQTRLEVDATNGVLVNDTDIEAVDQDVLRVVGFDTLSDHGAIVTVSADGSFTYDPTGSAALAALGTGESIGDTFTYTADDAHGGQDTATVTVIVTGENAPPIAMGDTYTVAEDNPLTIGPLGVLANDTDIDGNTLSAVLDNLPQHGTLNLSPDGSFVYTPDLNFYGIDSFTYQATDSIELSVPASVSITVTSVQDSPIAIHDSYLVDEDQILSVAPGVLSNDMDSDSDSLSAALATGPAHGTVTLNADGSFVYTPEVNYFGFDSFTYKANDGTSSSNPATVTISIGQINDPPISGEDAYATDEQTPLNVSPPGFLGNDSDPEGHALSAIAGNTTSSQGASVSIFSNGSFTYDPIGHLNWVAEGETVVDTFDYIVVDSMGEQTTVTVRVSVSGVNEAPVADDDTATTDKETAVFLDAIMLDGDTDPDTQDVLRVVGVIMFDTLGAVTLDQGTLLYDPTGKFDDLPLGETATDSFDYIVTDDHGGTDMGTIVVTITGSGQVTSNNPPVADADKAATLSDTAVAINVLDGDVDIDPGDTLSVVEVDPTSANGAILSINTDGTVQYDPAGKFNDLAGGESSVDTFSYTVADQFGGTDTAEVSVTVTGKSTSVGIVLPITGSETILSSDWVTLSDQVSTEDGLIYGIQAESDGVLTIVASHDPAAGDLTLVLVDADGEELASSTGGVMTTTSPSLDASWLAGDGTAGQDRIDFVVTSGTTYYFALIGDGVEADVTAASLLSTDGTNVTVFGTDLDDVFVFEPVASYLITINDISYHFEDSELSTVTFDGAVGSDSARLVGTSNSETADVYPGHGTLTNDAFLVEVLSCEQITVVGSGGERDFASMFDSAGNDTMVARDRGARLFGTGYTNIIEDYDIIHAYSKEGGFDDATLLDSPGDDEFVARPDWGILSGDDFFYRAKFFDTVHAYSKSGGYDTSRLYGSEGHDIFVGEDYYGKLYGENYLNRAKFFDSVVAYSVGTGDEARLFGSEGDDVLEFSPDSVSIVGSEFQHQAIGFSNVNSDGRKDGNDIARLHDSPGDDLLQVSPEDSTFVGDNLSLLIRGYEQIESFATTGFDVAELFDSPGDETFNAYPDQSTLVGDGFSFQVTGFDGAHAYGREGGTDIAHLYDSAGDDTFAGRYEWSRMFNDDYVIRAKFFDQVHAYSTNGGTDKAFLYDSTGNDTFEGRPDVSKMEGSGHTNSAHSFEEVYARSNEGGYDQANLYDSEFDDMIVAESNWATVSSANDQLDYLYSIIAFESAKAHSSTGNDLTQIAQDVLFLETSEW